MTPPVRALFLSTSFPPNADSQAIRSLHLMQGLDAPEWEWTIVTPGSVGGDVGLGSFGPLVPRGARVELTPPVAYSRRVASLERLALGRNVSWLFKNVWYRVAFPDVHAGWDVQAERLALRTGREFDVVVSASGSATAHIAAARLAKGWRVPWVADYGDPWHFVDREHRPLVAGRSERVERELLPNARTVIFTTEATRRLYIDWLGADMPSSVVLPYGYREQDFALGNARPRPSGPPESRKATVSHVGAAYLGNRTLIPLIRAVAAHRARYRIEIVGDHSSAFDREVNRLGLTDATLRQRVDYAEAIHATLSADVLAVVGNKGPMQVPGKVYVALAAGRPILYLSQRDPETDPAWQVLASFPGVVRCDNEERAVTGALAALSPELPRLSAEAEARRTKAELRALEARSLAREFGALLREAVGLGSSSCIGSS